MNERLILGKFINSGSWVHGIDPRAKITAMLLYFAVIMMADSLPQLLVVAVFSLVMMRSSLIPYTTYFRAFKPLRFLILFIFLFPILFEHEGALLLGIRSWGIHSDGMHQGVVAAVRMMLFVSFTSILTFTTPPSRLTQGLEDMLRPFRGLGLSPEKWSLMITIALRFIPTILDEAHIILKAQASRGADFNERSWKDKAKVLISLLVPVTTGAFRRATDLIDSMESRGFRLGASRSKFHVLVWNGKDTLFITAFVLLMILNWWGGTF